VHEPTLSALRSGDRALTDAAMNEQLALIEMIYAQVTGFRL
jgi:hypothetical protein